MKGFIILNSLIIVIVIMIKIKFKPTITIPYDKEIKRFNINDLPKRTKKNQGLFVVNERFGPIGDVIIFVIYLMIWSIWQLFALSQTKDSVFRVWFLFIGVSTAVTLYFSIFETVVFEKVKKAYEVVMVIPVYNEDLHSLSSCLDSILRQTRLPNEIHIVNDGSSVDYQNLMEKYRKIFTENSVYYTWQYQTNRGKRQAQISGLENMRCAKENAIVVTVDSDGILSDNALEEGLKPFNDKAVKSVAGVIVSKQVNKNILTKIVDLIIVIQQQYERAALSALGTVSVNSGALALYRYEVIEKAVNKHYLEETFANKELKYSDDSYLTLVALSMGKTVTQRTAVSFADMPLNFNHHYRQQLRWMRGSFVRGMWRIKVAPVNSVTFIRQTIGWLAYFSTLYIFAYVLIHSIRYQQMEHLIQFSLPFMLIPYVLNLKYLKIQRSDVSFKQQFLTYLLSPLAYLWHTLVIKSIKFIAFLTLANNEWGTRTNVESV